MAARNPADEKRAPHTQDFVRPLFSTRFIYGHTWRNKPRVVSKVRVSQHAAPSSNASPPPPLPSPVVSVLWVPIAQFRYVKIQSKTIDLSSRLRKINPTNSVVIPRSLVLRSIVLGWILIYRNWAITKITGTIPALSRRPSSSALGCTSPKKEVETAFKISGQVAWKPTCEVMSEIDLICLQMGACFKYWLHCGRKIACKSFPVWCGS